MNKAANMSFRSIFSFASVAKKKQM